MTTLVLTHVAIAPASDPSNILFLAQYSEGQTTAVPAEVRRYAGGRDRVITGPGSTTSITMAFRYMTRADLTSLEALIGQLVIVRDQRGRRIWGVIAGVTASEWLAADRLEDVSVTHTSSTYSEVV